MDFFSTSLANLKAAFLHYGRYLPSSMVLLAQIRLWKPCKAISNTFPTTAHPRFWNFSLFTCVSLNGSPAKRAHTFQLYTQSMFAYVENFHRLSQFPSLTTAYELIAPTICSSKHHARGQIRAKRPRG